MYIFNIYKKKHTGKSKRDFDDKNLSFSSTAMSTPCIERKKNVKMRYDKSQENERVTYFTSWAIFSIWTRKEKNESSVWRVLKPFFLAAGTILSEIFI